MVSDSTLQLNLKKLLSVEFDFGIKQYPQWPGKAIKIFPLFSSYVSVWGKIFFTYFNQNNIPQHTESRSKRIQLSSFKPDL